ncbi:MAG: TolC family protein [Deltaproteobacteria bacterium]|nr:TolC family protein [Deltaproteobacteria bacterium]
MLIGKLFRLYLVVLTFCMACVVGNSCVSMRRGGLEKYIEPTYFQSHRQATGEMARLESLGTSESMSETVATRDAGPLDITIGEAILLALENNRALIAERMSPSIRQTFEDEENAQFDPTFKAGLSGSRKRIKSESSTTGSDIESGIKGVNPEIGQYFPTGTSLSFGLTSEKDWSDLYSDYYSTRVGLSVTQALLRGAGLDVNLADVRQARLDTLSSQYELRGFTEDLVAEVETTYWNYTLAQRQIEIYQQSDELAEQQLNETMERINVGKLAETELAAAKAEVALRREALINAQSSLKSIRLRLLRLLNPPGSDLWTRMIVIRNLPAVADVKLDSVEAHTELALRLRSDLNQARLSLQRGQLDVVKTKNGLLPRMDLFISFGKTGYADSFGSSVRDLDGKSNDIYAGIEFAFPIGNRDAESLHRRAVLTTEQARIALENLSQLAELDVRSAYIEVNRASEQIEATAATRKLQEEKLRAETEKFRVGKSTSLLVAQSQRDLVDSQIAEIEATVNHLNSLVELFRLEGSLLERRGISTDLIQETHLGEDE